MTSTNAVDVLHPDWVAALERTGLGVTSPAHAALWAESGRHPIPDQHLELFHRRAAGERLADLGRDVDEHHARVQQILRLTGLRPWLRTWSRSLTGRRRSTAGRATP